MRTEFTYEEIQKFVDNQLKTDTRSIKWIDDDECLYRGRVIRRYDNVPVGYGGRYAVKNKALRHSFARMSDAKVFIDQLIKNNSKEFSSNES